jgi:hypothetical protein
MKRLLLLISITLFMFSCGKHHAYTINGDLPSNKYDGEWVYLTPAENANSTNVDSVRIKDGKFTFTGDSERVSIIRLKPILRPKIQELFVVTEEGTITAHLGTNSTCSGTSQNDLLQEWKEVMMTRDVRFTAMMVTRQDSTDKKDASALTKQYFESEKDVENVTLKIIHKHQGSTLQKFLTNLTGKR